MGLIQADNEISFCHLFQSVFQNTWKYIFLHVHSFFLMLWQAMQHRRFIFSVQGVWGGNVELNNWTSYKTFIQGLMCIVIGIPGEDLDYRFICPFLWVTLKILRESWREKQLHFWNYTPLFSFILISTFKESKKGQNNAFITVTETLVLQSQF